MANRRMLSVDIVESDAFCSMPLSTQALYMHLIMNADDDGFVGRPKMVQRMIGASDDDMTLLLAKRFVLVFESGVVVIKHWKMNNYIQNDRYKPTVYTEEKSMLEEKPNKSYTFDKNRALSCMDTDCIQNVSKMDTQYSIDKDSIDKSREDILSDSGNEKDDFCKEVIDYLNAKIGSRYKSSSQKTKKLINARRSDGYDLEDFKTVIDKKCESWLNDPEMSKYLRPETLFGTKFESYLNEVHATKTYFTADAPSEGGEGWLNKVDLKAWGMQ